ncbi:MAG TPA: hypothetical protein ENI81_12420 [Phycisphaerales bacterium]|nr:hypothetical protein [Phycisphaerales bacterium]
MKNYIIGLVVLIVLAVGVFVLLRSPDADPQPPAEPSSPVEHQPSDIAADLAEPPPGAIVFDMKYRGLSGEKDELRYNSYWGLGQSVVTDTAFISNVRKKTEQIETVQNRYFTGAEWAAVEVKDKEPIAFYFDLDADGKVSDNEKILPTHTEDSTSSRRTEFVTPDFVMNTQDGNQVPFRALLQTAFYGSSSRPQCMWSPSCVLEGKSTIAGEPTKLILYTSGFSGSFTDFGRCSYSLLEDDGRPGQRVSRQTLSSLLNHKGQYYRLNLHGAHEKDSNVRAVLEKYTGATGEVAVNLTGNSNLTVKLSSARLVGAEDTTICFSISGGQSILPAEAYKLRSGYIVYGSETAERCRVSISEGPEFEIEAGKTRNVELGNPTLSVRVIDEKKRYHSDVEEKSVFSDGTTVYLSPKITGKAGELYGRFSQRPDSSRNYKDVEPTIRIVDSNGRQVASATMKYG